MTSAPSSDVLVRQLRDIAEYRHRDVLEAAASRIEELERDPQYAKRWLDERDRADALSADLTRAREETRHLRSFHRCEDHPTDAICRSLLAGSTSTETSFARPRIVCLCGSTRFMDAFFAEGWRLTLEGKIVLSVGVVKHGPADHAGEWLGPDVVAALGELHLRKIDLADEVLVLNVSGYIGESTRREIAYAERTGKPVRYLETSPAVVVPATDEYPEIRKVGKRLVAGRETSPAHEGETER